MRAVELPKVRVKGKHDELTIYRVLGTQPPALQPEGRHHTRCSIGAPP